MDIYLGRFGETSLYMEAEEVGGRVGEVFGEKINIPLYDVTGFRMERAKVKPTLETQEGRIRPAIGPTDTAGTMNARLTFENGASFVLDLDESLQLSKRQSFNLTNIAAPTVSIGWSMKPLRKRTR